MNEKEIITIILTFLLICLISAGAGYIKGSIDATTALSQPMILCGNVLIELQRQVLDCEKELWINERNASIPDANWFQGKIEKS